MYEVIVMENIPVVAGRSFSLILPHGLNVKTNHQWVVSYFPAIFAAWLILSFSIGITRKNSEALGLGSNFCLAINFIFSLKSPKNVHSKLSKITGFWSARYVWYPSLFPKYCTLLLRFWETFFSTPFKIVKFRSYLNSAVFYIYLPIVNLWYGKQTSFFKQTLSWYVRTSL